MKLSVATACSLGTEQSVSRLETNILTPLYSVPARVKALHASCVMNQGHVVQQKPSSSQSYPPKPSHNKCDRLLPHSFWYTIYVLDHYYKPCQDLK